MNRADLAVLIAQKMECTQAHSIKFMNAFCESMLEALEKDDKVQISGLGTFFVHTRAGRGRELQKNGEVQMASIRMVSFEASYKLKKLLKEGKA